MSYDDYTDEDLRRYHLQRVFVNGHYMGIRNDPNWHGLPGCEDPIRSLTQEELDQKIYRSKIRPLDATPRFHIEAIVDSKIISFLKEMMKYDFDDSICKECYHSPHNKSTFCWNCCQKAQMINILKNKSESRSELKMAIKYELVRTHIPNVSKKEILDIFNSHFDNCFGVDTEIGFIKESLYKLKMFWGRVED